jgi:hypothetical protein
VERVSVQVEPYGEEFVKIISGLAEGDELKAQEQPSVSGWNRQNGAAAGAEGRRQDVQPTPFMPGMPGGGPSGNRSSGGRVPGGGG